MVKKLRVNLKGERLTLKRNKVDNELAKNIFHLVDENRKYLSEWLPWVDFTKEKKDSFNYLKETDKDKSKENYGIYEKNKLIGMIGIFDINEKVKSCEVGYWMSKDVSGKGYMTEALSVLENELFNKGFNRVQICCDERNIGSRKVMEKNNYVFEGKLREDDVDTKNNFRNTLIYSKLKREYKN